MIVNGERELAYVVKVTDVLPMDADRLENVKINGWSVVCGKGEFKKGDLGIFFEIDSKLPEIKPFTDMEFLVKKHFKIKTQKIRGVYSQGLLIPITAIAEMYCTDEYKGTVSYFKYNDEKFEENSPMTKALGVTYYIPGDNKRKAANDDIQKYVSMAQRHKDLFKKPMFKWLMRREWGKKLLFIFFGRKTDKPLAFPTQFEFVHKTDEERVENIPFILECKDPWIKTCKVDGTSSTYILERKKFGKYEYYVTSRNVRQKDRDQKNFHNDMGNQSNVYWDMSDKYHIREFLQAQLELHPSWKYVCLQGETAGPNVQGNPHGLKEVQFFGFNFIDSEVGRWNSIEAANLCAKYNIPWVPIVDTEYILPDDMEEFKLSADGPCDVPGSTGNREGFVYRSKDGTKSFKNVSREYIMGK